MHDQSKCRMVSPSVTRSFQLDDEVLVARFTRTAKPSPVQNAGLQVSLLSVSTFLMADKERD